MVKMIGMRVRGGGVLAVAVAVVCLLLVCGGVKEASGAQAAAAPARHINRCPRETDAEQELPQRLQQLCQLRRQAEDFIASMDNMYEYYSKVKGDSIKKELPFLRFGRSRVLLPGDMKRELPFLRFGRRR